VHAALQDLWRRVRKQHAKLEQKYPKSASEHPDETSRGTG
jgi:hypothetical protein